MDNQEITYVGTRSKQDDFAVLVVVEIKDYTCGEVRNVPLVQVVRHSPTGMEWGYEGSGPADLALSMLVDYGVRKGKVKDKKEAIKKIGHVYMDFKSNIVAKLAKYDWRVKGSFLEAYWKAI